MTAPIDITPAAVAAMLEGVTKGPWAVDGPPWNQTIWSSAENRVAFMAHSNGLNDDRDIATARFIAYAREAVPALSAECATLAAAVTSLREQVATIAAHRDEVAAKLAEVTAELDHYRNEEGISVGMLTAERARAGEGHEEAPDFDPAEQRREIAEKMAARGFASPLGGAGPQTPDETAEHFGREMFRLHGRAWPLMIALASGAAMQAERDAMGEVE